MSTQIKVLEGYLRINENKYGDASHVGQININYKNYWLYGWFEEKELTDEYGKSEKTKYFKLWTTDNKANIPNKSILARDVQNIGYLSENVERETHRHPMYKGEIQVNGNRYFLSSWKNTKKEMVNGDLVIKTIFALKISVPNNSNSYEQSNYNNQDAAEFQHPRSSNYGAKERSDDEPDYSNIPF